MKKGLALLLALVLAIGLLGCGSAAGEDGRLTLARKALPDEPELSLAGIANLDDVCLIWVTAGGGEETSATAPRELPAAFMLLAADYDYRFVDKNGSDMAG